MNYRHGFNIDGKYHEIGPFASPYLAKHWVENHYRGKKIEYVPLKEPEPQPGPVSEIKVPTVAAPSETAPPIELEPPAIP